MLESLPDVLVLNKNYEPIEWANYEEYACKHAKGHIIASLGQTEVTLHGGTNARTGLQSKLIIDSIVVINSNVSPYKYQKPVPALSNHALFHRDFFMCAYCGQVYKERLLTREHVLPQSKGGPDVWENCVSACRTCNSLKDDRTPEQAGMELLFLPYAPSSLEAFTLKNRKILVDQMQFLLAMLPKSSRLHLKFS